jgi:hypothetical protein
MSENKDSNAGEESAQAPTAESIMRRFEELEAELGELQFAFVAKYMFNKDFRTLVYEEKKLQALDPATVHGAQINTKFGDPSIAKLIWKALPEDRREHLSEISWQYSV